MKNIKKKKNQAGIVSDVVIGILLVLTLAGWLVSRQQATPAEVQAVVASAEGDEAATNVIKGALKETPTPTVGELNDIREQVDDILVLDTARAVTGNPALKSSAAVKLEEKAQAHAALDTAVSTGPSIWIIKGLLSCIAIFLGINGFTAYQRSRNR